MVQRRDHHGRATMKILAAAVIALFAGSAAAQVHQHKHGQAYAGMQERSVKALSNQQIADLRAGRGMALALAAELNGYPGPLHVLELADRLQLTIEQERRVRQLYEGMKAEAIAVGEKLIAIERELDQECAAHTMTTTKLASLMVQIGGTQGELRAVHLK